MLEARDSGVLFTGGAEEGGLTGRVDGKSWSEGGRILEQQQAQ